jgi:hypothetical protein
MLAAIAAFALALSQAPSQTASPATAQPAPPGAEIRFSFEHPQLDPASYMLVIREDGSGHYQSTPGTPSGSSIDSVAPGPVDRDIQIRDPLLSTLFQSARSHHFFAIECEAEGSKVAFTGKKTVSYSGPDGHGECTYNWSRDPQLNQLADNLMAIAYTLEEGRRLAVEQLHSRLGLDAELENLQTAVKDRRALEIENIAPELQSIAADESVMNRARNRALAILNGGAPKH